MKILIGADLVPTITNKELFADGNAEGLVGRDLLEILSSADYRIFNLETPLTDTCSPILKCGPALIAPTASVAGYKALGVDCLSLANNHIMDQDTDGFFSTVKVLEEANIAYVGGGTSLEQAKKPFVIEKNSKKIGIYACAEHEFSIADETKAGANPFDPLESLDHIVKLKEQCDHVIVLYHGGKEHYRYPSPNLQKVCRKLVDKGADLVICQHSHCIGCEEKYQNGTIVYGQGNFLFDYSSSEFWKTALLIEIDENFDISYIPLKKDGRKVALADGEMKQQILSEFFQRSEQIKQKGVVEQKYREFADQMRDLYLFAFLGVRKGFFFKVVNKLSGHRFERFYLERKYKKEKLIALRNFIECEAHRELILEGLHVDTDK
jgi:poly-gamma-glutamate synthesis protein (capsule biosynthesis protein)